MNNGSPRRPVSGRGLPLLVGDWIAEMGLGWSWWQFQITMIIESLGLRVYLFRESHRRNKHQVCFFKRRREAQYSRIAIMDDGKSNVAHDDTGCILLDNAGAYCPDVPSLLIRRRYCAECRITFDVAAPRDSKGRPEAVSLWVSSPPRQSQIN